MEHKNRQKISAVILFIFIVCLLIILGKNLHLDVDHIRDVLHHYPLWLNAIFYILLYVISTTLIWIGPKDIVRVFGALFYGGAVSTILIYAAELINAGILFHASRKLGRDVVIKKWFHKDNIDKAQDHTTLLGIMALRINVLFSFRLLDLAYGLTRVSFRKYLTAAIIASPLRLFVIQYAIVLFWDVFKTIKTLDQSTVIRMILQMSNIMLREPLLIQSFLAYLGVVIFVSIVAVMEKMMLQRERKKASLQNIQSEG